MIARKDQARALAEELCLEAVETLHALLKASSEAVRLAAVRELLDRVWGRPRQESTQPTADAHYALVLRANGLDPDASPREEKEAEETE